MKKYTIDIPEPCHEKWEQMSPTGRGRHCATCDKVVVDFTGMKDEELLQYLLQHKNVCGRVRKDQLQRPVFLSQPQKKYHWPAIAAMLVAGMFQVSPRATAQVNSSQSTHSQVVHTNDKNKEVSGLPSDTSFMVKGTVFDEMDEPIPLASISIAYKGISFHTMSADIDGNFSICLSNELIRDSITLIISSIGFETFTYKIPAHYNEKEPLRVCMNGANIQVPITIFASGRMIVRRHKVETIQSLADETITLLGRVMSANGPVFSAAITLEQEGKMISQVTVDMNGYFVLNIPFKGLDSSTRLSVNAVGFMPKSIKISSNDFITDLFIIELEETYFFHPIIYK